MASGAPAMQHETSLWANRRCFIICCIVSTANLQYGFDSAAIGGLQAMPGFLQVFGYRDPMLPTGYGIDSTVQQLISSLLTLGSFLSSLAAGSFSSILGRRHALWVACLLNAVACAIQLATTDHGVLYLGRLLMGFANGFFVTFSNVYTAEASPAHLRGVIVALFAYWVTLGSLFGTVVNNYAAKMFSKLAYQIPIACLYIIPTFLGVALFFLPESPRWLLHRGRTAEARRALERLRGTTLPAEHLELEWAEMLKGVEQEKESAEGISFLDMYRGVNLRRTLLCYGIISCQAASGSWFFIAYQTYFFSIAGITNAFQLSIMSTCVGFAGVNVGMVLMRKFLGRRKILMIGATACCICHLVPAVAWSVIPNTKPAGNIVVAMLSLFTFWYNGFVGAASYPVATELVSSRLRAWTVGSATSIGYILAWLTSFCTPYFINPTDLNWGASYCYIWAASNLLCIIFFFFFIPEMKGRSLEELDELFANRVPAKKFKGYQCQILEESAQEARGQDLKTPSEQVEKL